MKRMKREERGQTMNADQEFEKYAKEHLLEPNNEYGSAYTIARYWFMLGWDSRHETMRDLT